MKPIITAAFFSIALGTSSSILAQEENDSSITDDAKELSQDRKMNHDHRKSKGFSPSKKSSQSNPIDSDAGEKGAKGHDHRAKHKHQ